MSDFSAKKPSRRAERTRHQILHALMELMAERRYDDLTVQDVLDRARVGRATFYAHFRNKEDLFRASMERMRVGLMRHWEEASRAGQAKPGEMGFAIPFLKHVDESRGIWRSLVGGEGGAIVDRHFRRIFAEMTRLDLSLSRSIAAQEARVQFFVGGMMAIVNWWIDGDVPLRGEDVYELLREAAVNGIGGPPA